MSTDQWNRIEKLVEQTLNLSPDERAAFLEGECIDDLEILNEVKSMVQAEDAAFSFIQNLTDNVIQPTLQEMINSPPGTFPDIDAQFIGKTFSGYRITKRLGSGGMGIVYKANDTKLERNVALKFLNRPPAGKEMYSERFILEAKAAAALNHPNICTVHDIDEHDGIQFIVMEAVEGETLRQKLSSNSPGLEITNESENSTGSVLSTEQVLEYAIQIAEAIGEAHKKEIIHRDIKPENIMVDLNNRVKVMDFGLAKLKGPAHTVESISALGTLSYMSPEQLKDEEVSPVTDIFSFGIVLYEMVTGLHPFTREFDSATMKSIIQDHPKSIAELSPQAPGDLDLIVNKMLEKEPENRYTTAEELIIDLRRCLKNLQSTDLAEIANNKMGIPSLKESPLAGITGLISLLFVAVYLMISWQASNREFSVVWQQSTLTDQLPDWFSPGDTRGFALGKMGEEKRIYVPDKGNMEIHALDPADGSEVIFEEEFDLSNVEGGYFDMIDLAISEDGVLFLSNLTLDAGTYPLKIYWWESEGGSYDGVFEFTGEANERLGDKIAVVGSLEDNTIEIWQAVPETLPGGVYKFTTENQGENWNYEVITLSGQTQAVPMNAAIHPLNLGGDADFYISGANRTTRRYNSRGEYILGSSVPASIHGNGLHIRRVNNNDYLAVYNYLSPDLTFRTGRIMLFDITDASNPVKVSLTPYLGHADDDTFSSIYGMPYIDYAEGEDQITVYGVDSSNGFAAYRIRVSGFWDRWLLGF